MNIVLMGALVILVLAGIWLVVELVFTVKSVRKTVVNIEPKLDKLNDELVGTLQEVKPVLANIDSNLTEIQGSVQEVRPLLTKAGTAIDAISLNLLSMDEILHDVSEITHSAACASNAVGSLASNAAGATNQVLEKVRTKLQPAPKSTKEKVERVLEAAEQNALDEEGYLNLEPHIRTDDEGYFTYPHQD